MSGEKQKQKHWHRTPPGDWEWEWEWETEIGRLWRSREQKQNPSPVRPQSPPAALPAELLKRHAVRIFPSDLIQHFCPHRR